MADSSIRPRRSSPTIPASGRTRWKCPSRSRRTWACCVADQTTNGESGGGPS